MSRFRLSYIVNVLLDFRLLFRGVAPPDCLYKRRPCSPKVGSEEREVGNSGPFYTDKLRSCTETKSRIYWSIAFFSYDVIIFPGMHAREQASRPENFYRRASSRSAATVTSLPRPVTPAAILRTRHPPSAATPTATHPPRRASTPS
jgi:hypothetical protein